MQQPSMVASRSDYSWSESAVTFWAMLTLAVMAVTLLLLRYVTDPVNCFLPAQFEPSQVAYATQACFQSQTIYAVARPGPDRDEPPPNPIFTYHQWIPFFLGACAVLCLFPHILWRIFNPFLWLDTRTLVRTIANNQKNEMSTGRQVVLHDCALMLQSGLKGGNSILTIAIMGRKALVAAVIFTELVLMVTVFAPQQSGLNESEEEEDRPNNSTVTIPLPVSKFMCYFTIRQLTNVHHYTVQCIMPLAQVYTKGMAFLFYLFLALFLLFTLDTAVWAGRLFAPGLKDVAVRRYLSVALTQSDNSNDSGSLNNFLQSLGPDGRLLLSLAGDCCGFLTAADLTNHLWAVFKGTPRPAPASSAVCGSASAPHEAILMTTVGDKDGGDTPAADSEKEKPC